MFDQNRASRGKRGAQSIRTKSSAETRSQDKHKTNFNVIDVIEEKKDSFVRQRWTKDVLASRIAAFRNAEAKNRERIKKIMEKREGFIPRHGTTFLK